MKQSRNNSVFLAVVAVCVALHAKSVNASDFEASVRTFDTRTKSSTNVHPEYPRPSMVRRDWKNLNGSWEFGITYWTQTNAGEFPDHIQVPFPEESVLSGTKRRLITERQRLWYRRTFTIPREWRDQHVLLNFDAVDWETKVWLNGKEMGIHQGGYDHDMVQFRIAFCTCRRFSA